MNNENPDANQSQLFLHMLYTLSPLSLKLSHKIDISNYLEILKELDLPANNLDLEFHQLGQFFDFQNNSLEITSRINGIKTNQGTLGHGDRLQLNNTHFLVSQQRDHHVATIFHNSKLEDWARQLKRIPQISSCDHPILILGPSGSGKEHLSHQICQYSPLYNKKMVSVNCSALTESLIESELFGHLKGAFTGAHINRKGAFEEARGGTLFLDEIGDLPLSLQPKLLRALENKEIRPVGSDKPIATDVRIVAATHQNLEEKVLNGSFRQDLYFRLNVITISTPPLTDRLCDFEDLLYYFCKSSQIAFDPLSVQVLKKHRWSGNIRELRNLISRAQALFGNKKINSSDLSELIDIRPPSEPILPNFEMSEIQPGIKPTFEALQKRLIIESLKRYQGNQRKTADALGMPKSTLHDRLKSYQIDAKDFKF